VRVELIPREESILEVTQGQLLVGEEYCWYQEVLQEWYFACFMAGTLMIAVLYWTLWSILVDYWRQHQEWADLHREPPCDLNSMDDNWSDLFSRRESSRNEKSSVSEMMPPGEDESEGEWEDLR